MDAILVVVEGAPVFCFFKSISKWVAMVYFKVDLSLREWSLFLSFDRER
jgi:hypothetical protein